MERENTRNLPVTTAKAVSLLFHPLVIPLYGLLVIFFSPTLFQYLPVKVKEILFFIFLINNILIPVSLVPFFRYWHYFTPAKTEEKREKLIPLITVSFLYLITSIIMFRLHIPVFLKVYSYSLTILSVVLFVLSLRMKISLHSAGGGALTALVMALSLKMSSGLPFLTVTSILLSGIILSSRLKLNIHKPSEVYTGFLIGFVILATGLLFFQ